MPLTFTLSWNVTPLPDNDIWFANAAAWTNYWSNQPSAQATLNPIATTIYVPQAFDNTLPIYDIQVNGVDQNIPSLTMFQSLVNQVAALDATVQALRTALKNAGLITNAQ